MQHSTQTVTRAQDQTSDPRAVRKQCFRGSPVVKALDGVQSHQATTTGYLIKASTSKGLNCILTQADLVKSIRQIT